MFPVGINRRTILYMIPVGFILTLLLSFIYIRVNKQNDHWPFIHESCEDKTSIKMFRHKDHGFNLQQTKLMKI